MLNASNTMQIENTEGKSENQQIQSAIDKQESYVAKTVERKRFCHWCPKQTEMESPVSFTLKSGHVVQFCNEQELNQFKKKYNYID